MLTPLKNVIKKSSLATSLVRHTRGALNAYRYARQPGERFRCPICNYEGPFLKYSKGAGFELYDIEHTQCPRCELYERHRLQHLVISDLVRSRDFSDGSVLHFAPEPRLARLLKKNFRIHHTADLFEPGMDFKVDITAMPFADNSYDMVFASHVLEHVVDDAAALREICRVLRPGGIAVLPVPIVSPTTIEYGEENPFEFYHVRACGIDYFDRYRQYFSEVSVVESGHYPAEYQLYTYERRDQYPTPERPRRTPMEGRKHADFVPVCRL